MEQYIYDAARNQSLLYGLFAVLLAVATGWLGRISAARTDAQPGIN